MPLRKELTDIWKNLQELDLRPLREAAQQEVRLALVGAPGVGKRTLASQLRSDPARPQMRTTTPLIIAELDIAEQAEIADAIILLVDVNAGDVSREQELLNKWLGAGRRVLLFYNKLDLLPEEEAIIPWLGADGIPTVYGCARERESLEQDFVAPLLALLPDNLLALGRGFPLLRVAIARQLIHETCFANAAYALGSGLAEIIPVVDIPLNVADMLVLTKAQALLVYKLGLALGLPLEWRYYVGEFGGVIGGGFLWRQLARQLVGLIPIWGIVPKVGVAYSGTYVVGQAVLQWYLTGRHISTRRMRQLSREALVRGKGVARALLEKIK